VHCQALLSGAAGADEPSLSDELLPVSRAALRQVARAAYALEEQLVRAKNRISDDKRPAEDLSAGKGAASAPSSNKRARQAGHVNAKTGGGAAGPGAGTATQAGGVEDDDFFDVVGVAVPPPAAPSAVTGLLPSSPASAATSSVGGAGGGVEACAAPSSGEKCELESSSRDGGLPVQQASAKDQGAAMSTAGRVTPVTAAVAEVHADAPGRCTGADAEPSHIQRSDESSICTLTHTD
jgi:hypothetical protein